MLIQFDNAAGKKSRLFVYVQTFHADSCLLVFKQIVNKRAILLCGLPKPFKSFKDRSLQPFTFQVFVQV